MNLREFLKLVAIGLRVAYVLTRDMLAVRAAATSINLPLQS